MPHQMIGTDQDLLPLIPAATTSSSRLGKHGPLMGYNLDTREPFRFDPWVLKRLGVIESLLFMWLGEKGYGKSANAKLQALRLGMREHATQNRPLRFSAVNLKQTGGEAEYAKLARTMGSQVIDLSNSRLNIIDSTIGLSVAEHLENLSIIIQQMRHDTHPGRGGWIDPIELKVLKSALTLMARDSRDHHLLTLMRILNNEDVQLSLPMDDQQLVRVDPARVREACLEMTMVLDGLFDGIYGNMFGGLESITTQLSQRAVIFDYWGLSTPQVSLIQTLIWSFRASAARRKDHRFEVEMSKDDENHSLWRNPIYASGMAKRVATMREEGGMISMLTHQLGDYAASGSEDAMQMIQKVSGFFFGRTSADNARDLQSRFGFSDKVCSRLSQLQKGQFCFFVPGEVPVFFQSIIATPLEQEVCYSDGGHKAITGEETS